MGVYANQSLNFHALKVKIMLRGVVGEVAVELASVGLPAGIYKYQFSFLVRLIGFMSD